jgi:polygalacturonase
MGLDRTTDMKLRLGFFILVSLMPAPAGLRAQVAGDPLKCLSIADSGAVADGKTLNTKAIQEAIDLLATGGGGTLVVPKGIFLTASIFLKPSVNLHLEEGAVLKGSTNASDYPRMRTRIEGHYEQNFLPALVNADRCDRLNISGTGILDGSGEPYWQAFWAGHAANKSFKNLDVLRPQMALIENSEGVRITGITFKDSPFWTLHLYRCSNALVENVRFEVPDGKKCPSSDGIDVDSCQNVTIRGCTFRVDDDCICMKGSKGPLAMEDTDSPPVEHIRIENCIFERGHGVVTLGSKATVVRDVVVENCKSTGPIVLARLKLRPDTPQRYEDIHFRNITLDNSGGGVILSVQPWNQYFDLKGQQPPKSIVRNVTLSEIKGCYGSFGVFKNIPGQSDISDITLKDLNVQLKNEKLNGCDQVKNLKLENVTVNGKAFTYSPKQ